MLIYNEVDISQEEEWKHLKYYSTVWSGASGCSSTSVNQGFYWVSAASGMNKM